MRAFLTCPAMRAAGWKRGASAAGGTYRASWDTAERAVYAYNRKRFDTRSRGSVCR